ncbi:MAG: transporter [Campylobacter sp.]|nr:transporter [Campylobacter sp.]
MFTKLLQPFLVFVGCSLATILCLVCIYIDFLITDKGIGEISVTEITQEFVLLVIVILFLKIAKNHSENKNSSFLIAGLFLTMLIREFDALFDQILGHGTWLYFALFVTTFFCIITFGRNLNSTINELYEYSKEPSFGMMLSGLVCILVFSRVFGTTELWRVIIHEEHIKLVKNMVQESLELFGYITCLSSGIWCFFCQKRYY